MSTLSTLLSSLVTSGNSTTAANLIGQHITQQNNTSTTIKTLLGLANPTNVSGIAAQIAGLPGVPATVTPLLTELAEAKDQPTITAIMIQVEAALGNQSGVLGSVLSAL